MNAEHSQYDSVADCYDFAWSRGAEDDVFSVSGREPMSNANEAGNQDPP